MRKDILKPMFVTILIILKNRLLHMQTKQESRLHGVFGLGKKLAEAYNDHPVGTYAYRANKSVDYPTPKPIELLERIINASSKPGDLIMDFFAGSGTTLIAAEEMGRRWIGCGIGKLSIYTIQRRLLTMKNHLVSFSLIEVYFADDIKSQDGYMLSIGRKNILSNKIKVVYIDIFGNEFKEVLEV